MDDLTFIDELAEMLTRATEEPSPTFVESMVARVGRELPVERAALGTSVATVDGRAKPKQRDHSRALLAACILAVVALAAGAITWLAERDRHSPSSQVITNPGIDVRWESITEHAAGLGAASSFRAVVSLDDAVVLVGATKADDALRGAIWRTSDGRSWTKAAIPEGLGPVTAVGAHGSTVVAIGGGEGNGAFVLQSVDDGRTWTAVAQGSGLFGMPAPEMGRPFVGGLQWRDGWWVATGGGSDGYEGLWLSRDAITWSQVQLDGQAGSVEVVASDDGLFGYWVNLTWTAIVPFVWNGNVQAEVPAGYFLRTVAPGVPVAFVEKFEPHGQPTPLLRSTDAGLRWTIDPTFLEAYPGARVATVTRSNGLWVAAGASADEHPDAFLSADATTWVRMPEDVRGAPGLVLNLVAQIGTRTLLIGGPATLTAGSAPELDRYFVATIE